VSYKNLKKGIQWLFIPTISRLFFFKLFRMTVAVAFCVVGFETTTTIIIDTFATAVA
jgi:hypothetical protein